MPVFLTKKRIRDDVFNLLLRFSTTDESKPDPDWLDRKIDQVRAALIVQSYQEFGIIDQTWLSDLGLVSFNPVNFADDPSVLYCCSDLSKASIPNVVSLTSKTDSNVDLGLFIYSACGMKGYTYFPMALWKRIPKEHIRSKFNYYSRINTSLYVNKLVDKLKVHAILSSPEDGYLISSDPVLSGSIVNGTVYRVKGGTVIYAGVPYSDGTIFTAGVTTTFTGTGKVYLNSQLVALNETQPYPVSGDMARMIVLKILTEEFKIEASEIIDTINDSVDDTKQGQ